MDHARSLEALKLRRPLYRPSESNLSWQPNRSVRDVTGFRGAWAKVVCEQKHMGSRAVVVICRERAVCSGRLKRKRDTLLPLLEHAIAYLHEFRVRFNVGLQFL